MLLAIDVHYKPDYAKSVGVIFHWEDISPQQVIITKLECVEPYTPGEFYKRELPCILSITDKVKLEDFEAIIVDGHVFVDDEENYGLGGYLWKALNEKVPVIGVAKRAFHTNKSTVLEVLRGESKNPLYVSAVGLNVQYAADKITKMQGEFRMPTVLQMLDSETKKP